MELEGRVDHNTKVRMGVCYTDWGTPNVILGRREMDLPLKAHNHAFLLVQSEVPGCGGMLQDRNIPLAQVRGHGIVCFTVADF